MVNLDEGKREKWTNSEISVDHPKRRAETVRDPTVFTAGLTTGIVGLHCDIAVLDDTVTGDNALTGEGRTKVQTQYSFLSSIEGANAQEWVVGTRYHSADLYADMLGMNVDLYDDDGELVSSEPLYEVFERQLEDAGDGTGQYLWPRQQRKDGMWFGFDQNIRAKKYAQYLDKTQFRAQYYNDPNDIESAPINPELFQYYNRALLQRSGGSVYFNGTRLNVFAGVDFAYTLGKKSDFSAICVVGVDPQMNYYILDIERFKTEKISEYFRKILELHQKWSFRKIRAEVSAAQKIIVRDIKENYIKQYGLALSVDEYNPTSKMGSKEERIAATLYPRYENHQIWHYKGGNCQILEEELIQQNPAHDDVKDCLTLTIDVCTAPTFQGLSKDPGWENMYHKRFGGMS
jgi:phage terminase large subunit-like protein